MMIQRLTVTTLLALAATASAQCDVQFRPAPAGTATTTGVNNTVLCSCVWDPDGTTGPQPYRLVVAGRFGMAGGVSTPYIAMWDGSAWKPLGTGMNGDVYAMVEWNGELIACGSFTQAGGLSAGRVARWNGTSWQTLGTGLNAAAFAMTTGPDGLYVGGNFNNAGGATANRIATWDGTSWHAIMSGTSNGVGTGSVDALLYDITSQSIYVGGNFVTAGPISASHIARFDGAWHTMNSGMNGSVYALRKYAGEIVAGGQFTSAGTSASSGVAAWDGGNWHPLGTGVGQSSGAFLPRVDALGTYNGKLVIGGVFDSAGGSPIGGIATWDGSQWSSLGTGFPGTQEAYCLANFQGSLIAGGNFTMVDGQLISYIARWDDRSWTKLEPRVNGPVNAMLTYGGRLYAAGDFNCTVAAGQTAFNILSTDGVSPPERVLDASGFNGVNGPVRALGTYSSNPVTPASLVIAGDFTSAAGIANSHIVLYKQGVYTPMGAGVNNTVSAVKQYGTGLYAAGSFTSAGGAAASRIAKWSSGAWSPVGTGLNGSAAALEVYNNQLIIGGSFTVAGGVSAVGLAQYNGTTFSTLGTSGVNGTVSALAVYNGQLIVGGLFTNIGGVAATNIARWDGTAWSPMHTGLGNASYGVRTLLVHNNELYAGGYFGAGNNDWRVSVWDGASWDPKGFGVNSTVTALASYRDQLWVGGEFTFAGYEFQPYLSSFGCACYTNCDNSVAPPILNVNDFQCFLNQFANGRAYANCDHSTAAPVLNVNDFQCFLNKFASGCP